MPNRANITAPITLVANGRSGTSLVHKLFEHHPEVDVVGETADVILGTWYSLGLGDGIVRGQFDSAGKYVEHEDRAVQALRLALVAMFSSDKKYWMHKPIGTSFVRQLGQFWNNEEAFPTWYWHAFEQLFPQGRFLTILRNPCDVVLSSCDYWGVSQRDAWVSIGAMARIIMHPKSLVSHAIRYDNLVSEPGPEVRKLCEASGVPFHEQMLKATKVVHVPTPGTFEQTQDREKDRVDRGFSRQAQWERLDKDAVDPSAIESVRKMWEKYGAHLDLPSTL